jgi:hypothetical protein
MMLDLPKAIVYGTAASASVVSIAPWHADGKVFRRPDGTAEREKGVSQFRLQDRFARGR